MASRVTEDVKTVEPRSVDPRTIQRYILIDKPRIKMNEIDWDCTEKKLMKHLVDANQDELDQINLVNQNLFKKVRAVIVRSTTHLSCRRTAF